jgi:hypothetical protein
MKRNRWYPFSLNLVLEEQFSIGENTGRRYDLQAGYGPGRKYPEA